MDILPAIDLLGGSCVRLVQGRYDRVIDYQSEPVAVAQRFRDAGATWLHVIDLDGARDGRIANLGVLREIVRQTGARVQFGGGVRDEDAVQAALDAGAERIIIGTRALTDWDWFAEIAQRPCYAGKLALGLDARLGQLSVQGWTRETNCTALDVACDVAGWPLAGIVYTDIGGDGLLLGPNIKAVELMATTAAVPVIASGGVADIEDVRRLARLKLGGIVIGRAIYEGAVDLAAALAVAAEPAQG